MSGRIPLRRFVTFLLVASALYTVPFAMPILQTATQIGGLLSSDARVLQTVMLSAVGILVGHAIRALRGRILFAMAADTDAHVQFGAFSIGALCNVLLPFKLGEFIRADMLAQRYRISYSFTYVLICVERLVDALLLTCGLGLFGHVYVPLLAVLTALAAVVGVLWRSPSWFKHLLVGLAGMLSDRIQARTLFVFWSVEYGLKRTLSHRRIASYLLLSLFDWLVYVVSLLPTISLLLGYAGDVGVMASVETYVALSVTIAPAALGSFTPTLVGFGLSNPPALILLWAAATIPISLVGMVWSTFGLGDLPLFRSPGTDADPTVENKLARSADISADQVDFLHDYFSDSPLAQKIASDDIGGSSSIHRYFTGGGSGAVTYLSVRNGQRVVTKLVAIERSQALKEQYDWLSTYQCDTIAHVREEHRDGSTYSIDIEYEATSVDSFDWLHSHAYDEAAHMFDMVVETLAEHVWHAPQRLSTVSSDEGCARLRAYCDRHIDQSLSLAAAALPSVHGVMQPSRLVINGREYLNLAALMDIIRADGAIVRDLASFRTSPSIHGDLICDNIIWSTDRGCPVLFDPVPFGNCFDGPVFDFGKLSQSLQIGYEFMLRDTAPVVPRTVSDGSTHIEFPDRRSYAYEKLWRHVEDELAPRFLSSSELRTMRFIGATNYLRRMKHQAIQFPDNALKFYALGIKYLNEYVELFR